MIDSVSLPDCSPCARRYPALRALTDTPAQHAPSALDSSPQNSTCRRIPTEIWTMVLRDIAAVPENPCWHDSDKCSVKRNVRVACELGRVSRAFYKAARPLVLGELWVDDRNAAQVLHLLQRNKSSLGTCKKLGMVVFPFSESDDQLSESDGLFPYANEIADLVCNVHCLQLSNALYSFEHCRDSWRLIRRLTTNKPKLTHLSLSNGLWDGAFIRMVNSLDLSSIKTLDFDFDSTFWIFAVTPRYRRLKQDKHRTSKVQSISIRNMKSEAKFVVELMLWPQSLVHFSLSTARDKRAFPDFAALVTSLALHAASLRTVCISHCSRDSEHHIFNATQFPLLETLRWSRWQMASPLVFTPGDAHLLGPAVHTLIWDFDAKPSCTGRSLTWLDFCDREATWLSRLAETAIASHSALRRFHIVYTPSCVSDDFELDEDDYPWDMMNNVRDGAMDGEISLTYNEPTFLPDGTRLEFSMSISTQACAADVPVLSR